MTETILDKIKAYKLEEIAARKAAVSLAEVEAAARDAGPLRGFASSLKQGGADGLCFDRRGEKSLAVKRSHSGGFQSPRIGPCL
jgi:indole-3-glycerol phosphate synthase